MSEAEHCDGSNSSVSDEVSGWCTTDMNVTAFTYTWTIRNYSFYADDEVACESAPFDNGINKDMKWCIRIHPVGMTDDCKNYLSIYLVLLSSNKPEVKAKFKFFIRSRDGNVWKNIECLKPHRFVQGKDWGFKRFVYKELLLDPNCSVLIDDNLTIHCYIESSCDVVRYSGEVERFSIDPQVGSLSQDMSKLLDTGKFSDVHLLVHEKQLKAHRAILCTRSPVFEAIFESLPICNQNAILIHDARYEVLREMLRFIYTGEVMDLEEMASEMFVLSDKYGVERLKSMSQKALYKGLTDENAADILILSNTHNAPVLKQETLNYIKANASRVIETDSWKNLIKNHSQLLNQAYCALAEAVNGAEGANSNEVDM